MKKQLLPLLLIITSCKSFQEFSEQEYTLNEFGKQNMIIKDNKPLLEVTVNNEKGYFLFDTGATGSIITDSLYLKKIKSKENLKKTRSLTNASGTTIEAYKVKTDEIKSEIFDSKKILLSYYKLSTSQKNVIKCSKDNLLDKEIGIIGIDNFINSDKTVLLNFDNNTIEVLNENCNKNGYFETDGKIQKLNKKIYLPITLNNKKINFLFDTGNNSNLLIKENEFINLTPDYEGQMIIGNFNGFSIQKIKSYQNIAFNNFYFPIENQNIISLNPFKTNTMGMKFINKFNWLLDFKNKKIYIQKNKNPFEDKLTIPKDLQVLNLNGKLIIGFKSNKTKKFKINDEIISVNNIAINPENICEMQNLLNSTTNWEDLKIDAKNN
ncbi:MAG: hypothetical protein A3G95_07515 [Flavobacteria bacterium RIFCSPLOWO2_12_FULL_31_7]|nr:MAG: hypothetical protein A3G95_07515 [Flavobacteria bacterium RIFCSPLOWO2_12_FULL_31_7]